jgi:hypothetical protein
MAVPVNTTQTFDIRQREDLHNVIETVTPFDTPFFSSIGTGKKAEATYVEFAQDTIRAPNPNNAAIEGDNVTPQPKAKPVVLGNYTQIFDDTLSISDTAQEVKTISTESELMRQRVIAGRALRLDIEMRMCGNYPSVAGAAGAARRFAGALAWLTTGSMRSGTNGGWNAGTKIVGAATAGALRPLTEALFKEAIRKSYNATEGTRSKVILSPGHKSLVSAFTGIASNTNEVKSSDKVTIVGTADVYVSDQGRHEICASRYADANNVLIYSPEKWKKRFLQPFGKKELGTTGHNTQEMMKVEVTLQCHNEAANAVVADLTAVA